MGTHPQAFSYKINAPPRTSLEMLNNVGTQLLVLSILSIFYKYCFL
jgi:hypothetical protein